MKITIFLHYCNQKCVVSRGNVLWVFCYKNVLENNVTMQKKNHNGAKNRLNYLYAFRTLADCPRLLDVDDLMRMREPDWKCVYTYIQEFYRCLVEKGLVKTKKKMP